MSALPLAPATHARARHAAHDALWGLWRRETLTFMTLVELTHGVATHLGRREVTTLVGRGLLEEDGRIPAAVRDVLDTYVLGEGIHLSFVPPPASRR